MEPISEKIKKLRYEKKWSQETTAKKLNITRGKLGHWETGRTEPRLEDVVKIAKLFDCDVDYLLDDKPYKSSKNVSTSDIEEIKNNIQKSNDFTEENKKSLIDMVDYFHNLSIKDKNNKG